MNDTCCCSLFSAILYATKCLIVYNSSHLCIDNMCYHHYFSIKQIKQIYTDKILTFYISYYCHFLYSCDSNKICIIVMILIHHIVMIKRNMSRKMHASSNQHHTQIYILKCSWNNIYTILLQQYVKIQTILTTRIQEWFQYYLSVHWP